MKKLKKMIICLLVICMVLPIMPRDLVFAKGIKLSQKSITLHVGQTKKIKLKGTAKKPKWSSSKKSVATVTNNGRVNAKKKGNAVITAKLGKKKYKCKIKVKEKSVVPPTPTIETDDSTVAGNYQKLSKYIQNNGEYDEKDDYYYIDDILYLENGKMYTQIRYNENGTFEFSVMVILDMSYGESSNLLTLTITPPEYSEGTISEIFISNPTGLYYANGTVTISDLSETNTAITYTSTNVTTTSEKNSLYELGESSLGWGLSGWDTLLASSGSNLTLSDLGFTSYESVS